MQQVVAGILAKHPDIKGWSYEYGLGMAQGAFAAYKAAGKPFNTVLTLRTDDVGMGCAVQQARSNPKPQDVLLHLGQHADPGRLHGRDDEAQGREDPAQDRVPDPAAEPEAKRDSCVKGYPQEASATSLDPAEPAPADVPLGGQEHENLS